MSFQRFLLGFFVAVAFAVLGFGCLEEEEFCDDTGCYVCDSMGRCQPLETDGDADSDADGDIDGDADIDVYPDGDADSDADGDIDADADGDGDGGGWERCVPGRSLSCACVDGTMGAQVCLRDGTFGPCECVPCSAGGDSTDAGIDAEPIFDGGYW